MNGPVAIVAGEGRLPLLLAAALPQERVLWVTLHGMPGPAGVSLLEARFEDLEGMFDGLRARGVRDLVFAGAARRPDPDPRRSGPHARALAAAFPRGDDALLREVLALVEREGFRVLSPVDLRPDLVLSPGTLWGRGWDADAAADAARARTVLDALSPLDVGQAAVAAAGLVLGIETIQGTEALLDFVARTDPRLRRGRGVLVKAPKIGQEPRLDCPAIGPETVAQVGAAGLGGIVIGRGVLVIDREEVQRAVEAAGLFLFAA